MDLGNTHRTICKLTLVTIEDSIHVRGRDSVDVSGLQSPGELAPRVLPVRCCDLGLYPEFHYF